MKDRKKEPKWTEWSLARVRELATERKGKGVQSIKVKKSLPCIYVGEKLTTDELTKNGLGENRKWQWCRIGMAKNPGGIPGIVCKCSGCGPKCEGYKSP